MTLSSNALFYPFHLLPSKRLSMVVSYRWMFLFNNCRYISVFCANQYGKNHNLSIISSSLSNVKSQQCLPIVRIALRRSNSIVSTNGGVSSPSRGNKRTRKPFIPIKSAINVTPKAREYLKLLIANSPKERTKGIMINYGQGSDGSPRMVFTFNFLADDYVVNSLDEA
jgi:hypothetical protein